MHNQKTILFLCFGLLLSTLAYAAPAAGKVRSAMGDVSRQKKNQTSWSVLRVGSKVFQTDKVKTGQESELVLGLPDGSIITIEESSEIAISELLEEDGAYKTTIDIQSGRLGFAAQKQEKKTASFSFKTGTAVAAIRGTEGVISAEPFFAGLKNGKLEVMDSKSQKSVSIGAGQTTIVGDSLIVLELESSGDPAFAKRLATILSDTTQGADKVVETLKTADKQFQKELEEAKAKVNCTVEALPDTVFETSVTAKGKCSPNTVASLHGESVTFKEDGSFEMLVALDSASVGSKKFQLNCKTDSLQVNCGTYETYYSPRILEVIDTTITAPDTLAKDSVVAQDSVATKDTVQVAVKDSTADSLAVKDTVTQAKESEKQTQKKEEQKDVSVKNPWEFLVVSVLFLATAITVIFVGKE